MSSSDAAGPAHRPDRDPADPGRRPAEEADGPGGLAADGPGGEAAGGPGGEAAGGGQVREPGRDASRARGRGLAAYLLFPRPDAWAKAQMAPACFLLAAGATGQFAKWPRFLVLWLVLELLIYAARYQWNDIRGIEGDQVHAETHARSRLPVGPTARARHRSIRLSRAVAALRVMTALLVGALTGLYRQVLLLTGTVFLIAMLYEFLRALPARRSPVPGRTQVVAVWLVVGLGYLVRGGLGLSVAGLAWGSLAMAAGLVCVMSFGIMFVLLTWVLEATSYCAADAGGGWHARPDLAAKPHLAALLRQGLGRPILTDSILPGQGRYCGADRALRDGGRLSAPWNLALLAAAVSGAAEGLALARPRADAGAGYLAATVLAMAGAVFLARCRSGPGRWVITAAWTPALVGAALLAGPARPFLACLPWVAIGVVYGAFHGWSYRDLVTAGPAALRYLTRGR